MTTATLVRDAAPDVVLRALLARPGVTGVEWVAAQYDSTVGGNTVEGPGRGAAVVRLAGTKRGLAMAVHGNAAISALDPHLGAALSVAQAVRSVAVTGARPLGVTDCLNFGDPTSPEEFWTFREAVRGIADACRGLGLPVVGGNVSFYNASPSGAIPPTPQIGVVGLLDDLAARLGPAFAADADHIALVGRGGEGLAGSAFADLVRPAADDALPELDLAREAALHRFLIASAERRLLTAARDVGTGGVVLATARMALWGDRGAELAPGLPLDTVTLFGEGPSRVVVTYAAAHEAAVTDLAQAQGVDLRPMGVTGGDRLIVRAPDGSALLDIGLSELRRSSAPALPLMAGRA